MNKLTLNSTEFTINNYHRYTDISKDNIESYASIQFENGTNYNDLASLGLITRLYISIDGNTVYSLQSINARVTNINENLTEEGVVMTAQIRFEQEDSGAEEI